MNSIHSSIFARTLMASAASLVFLMTGAGEGRAESVFVQGADGANAIDPDVQATSGESVGATAGSMQPVTDPSNSASAIGGNGGNGGNEFANGTGAPGGGATATATTTVISGSAEADATAIGGSGGNFGANGSSFGNDGYGGHANASSTAVTGGSGDASSSANATGGAMGSGDFGFAGNAGAMADSVAAGGGKAVATAFATGGPPGGIVASFSGLANATSNSKTVNGAMADAQSIAVPGGGGTDQGQASSTAKTSFAGASVEATATAPNGAAVPFGVVAASTNAIAQGGSGQAFANPGETAYAFSIGRPDKAYATTLINGESNVGSALLGPQDAVFGTAILGANSSAIAFVVNDTYSASSTFDFAYRGDLELGLIDDQVSGFAGGLGFQSMEFTIMADGVEVLDVTFGSLAIAESFFRDDVIDLGADLGPNIDLTFGYNLVADGSGGFGFDFAVGGAVPEPSTWAMMLIGFAGLGFAGSRASRKNVAVTV
jgi:hypothetical protein